MKICVKCKQEMRCTKTGATVHFGGGHTYSGDLYECPVCGAEVVLSTGRSFYTEDHWNVDFDVDMD